MLLTLLIAWFVLPFLAVALVLAVQALRPPAQARMRDPFVLPGSFRSPSTR